MERDGTPIQQDLKEIVQTRMAIAEKLEAIEQHVGTTMHHARTIMTQAADKTTSSLRETMQATKESLDPHVHASRHPWMFVGSALVLGYVVGTFHRPIGNRVAPYYPPGAKGVSVMPEKDSPAYERQEAGVYPFYPQAPSYEARDKQPEIDHPTVWNELERAVHDELGVIRGSLIRYGRGVLREIVRQTIPVLVRKLADNQREGQPPRSDRDREGR